LWLVENLKKGQVMKKARFLLSLMAVVLAISLSAQNIELTFTGDNNGRPVSMDSVSIKNVTQGGEVTLYPPDLTLILVLTGTENELFTRNSNSLDLKQNYPNPFYDQTSIQLQMPGTGIVKFMVSNLLGQNLLCLQKNLNAGTHSLSFTPGNEGCYFLSASCKGQCKTIKMLCKPGSKSSVAGLRYSSQSMPMPSLKSLQMLGELPFELGDELLMIAYSELGESGMLSSPEGSQEYVLQFATNIACPDAESVNWGGQTYNTIQVFGQCWFKENLNIGTRINSSVSQLNNGIIEKYCQGNDEYYCDLLGGLYTWNEMMQYYAQTGGQGICPDGWHIPDDMDWQILEGAADSINKIGDPVWANNGWRGFDAGGNLKQTGTSYWEPPNSGATDDFGFEVLPAGYIVQNGFWGVGYKAYFWSSKYPQKYYRNLDWNQQNVRRGTGDNQAAFSVRCVKD